MRLTVVLDCLDPDRLVEFWSEALGYRHAESLPGYEILLPQEGEPPGPVFVLQRVPEPKAGKNRMHVDVHPPVSLGVSGLVERLEGSAAPGSTGRRPSSSTRPASGGR